MHILIGLLVGAGILTLWLAGNPFARIAAWLTFSALGVVFAIIAAHENAVPLIIFSVAFSGIAWLIAGLPTYYLQSKGMLRR